MVKIAVLVSGGGTNLQALINKEAEGNIVGGEICAVIASRDSAYALERARAAFIPTYVLGRCEYPSAELYGEALADLLDQLDVGLVVLAGFMTVLSAQFCRRFQNRIINVHPSLIPSFCGEGYYGLRVHEEALRMGVKVTGATVHFVSEVVDGGAIIAQQAVNIQAEDTPETLQKRVMLEAEHVLLPQAVSLFCQGRLIVKDGVVHIVDES